MCEIPARSSSKQIIGTLVTSVDSRVKQLHVAVKAVVAIKMLATADIRAIELSSCP